MSSLPRINNDFNGFQSLITLYEQYKTTSFDVINLTIDNFFAANQCAALAAVLEKFMLALNNINLTAEGDTKRILCKNDFLCSYGYDSKHDTNNTTIPYKKFDRNQAKQFTAYVMQELMPREGMPTMSDELKLRISSRIGEIFANSSIHTTTPYVFACGQFFPNKHTLDFTIADMGEGIKTGVNLFLEKNLSATKAIEWAFVDGNSTKTSGSPGGIGLALLKELIGKNKGTMQIVSNDGFYQYKGKGKEIYKTFDGEFPGTVVYLQFKTDDEVAYKLKGE